MSKQAIKGLLPVLRFPEFLEAGEWEQAKLRVLAKRVTAKNKDGKVIRVLTNSAADGIIDQRDYFDKDIAIQGNLEGYFIVDNGDYVYNPRVSNLAPVGPISKNKLGTGVMSPLYSVFRFKYSDNTFYEQYFKTSHWHHYLGMISNSGARHDRMSITTDNFMDMPLPVPCVKEQQKIAACLSSLDELITAQAQKVEALKTHKKSLMQQLFPAEGETVPKLRFPEFLEAGEWEQAKLRVLAKRITTKNKDGKVIRVLTNSAANGIVDQRDYFDKDIAIQGNLEVYFIVDNGDYVYNPRVSNLAPVGPISKNKLGTGVMSPLYSVFRFKCSDNTFYEQYFKTSHWHHYLRMISNSGARHDRMSITTDDFMDMPLPVPCAKEQQKIAACLSAVDELITAQSQKLNALKTHKKGLMQQLFPAVDEVNA